MSDAIFNDGTMCTVNISGIPGLIMSHTCVDQIIVPSGKLSLRGFFATCLFPTSALSMMKMAVALVSAIALFAAMVSAFKYCGMGLPNIARAVAMSNGRSRSHGALIFVRGECLEVMMVASSSLVLMVWPAMIRRVGSKERFLAETK